MSIPEEVLSEARSYWDNGKSKEAGRILIRYIPGNRRPAWGARVLEAAAKHAAGIPEVEAVLKMTRDPSEWKTGHHVFDAVRRVTLQTKSGVRECILLLAELVAKETYNSSVPCPLDPFDEDSGWWIPDVLSSLIKKTGDRELSDRAWALLTDAESFQDWSGEPI